jgi:hypothetical protein
MVRGAPQRVDSPVPETVAHAAKVRLGETTLQIGCALMLIAAATDLLFALVAGVGPRIAAQGVALTAVALAGARFPRRAAALLRPRGRAVICAALFAAVGCVDWGLQTHYSEVASALMWIAAIVSSAWWVLLAVVVSSVGYVLG